MTRLNKLTKGSLMTLLFMILSSVTAWAQPTVILEVNSNRPNVYEGCEEYTITFSAAISNLGALTVSSAELDFGGGDVVNDASWAGQGYQITRNLTAGTYNPTLRVTFSDNSTINRALSKPILVFNNPVADFELSNDKEQCFESNEFQFTDLSQTGALITGQVNANRITKWSWDFGDGAIGNQNGRQNPIHTYKSPGTFDILLTVEDEKGCISTHRIDDLPEVYPEIGVRFTANGPVGCPETDIIFRNFTTIDFNLVERWVWDWGIGAKHIETFFANNPEHVNNNWTNFTKRYIKDGYHSPKLTVYTKDGCSDSMILVDAIRVINYNFDIDWTPDTPCYYQNNITFRMRPRDNATQWLWTFGDPDAMLLNFDNESWTPSHEFVGGPGFYNVNLRILEPPCPIKDTTVCFVKLKGPQAQISLPPPPAFPSNSCKDPREIPYEDFERLKFDHCYRASYDPEQTQYAGSDVDEISYVLVDQTVRFKKDSYFVYCNAPIDTAFLDTAQNMQGVGRFLKWVQSDGIEEAYPQGCGPDDDSLGFRYVDALFEFLPEPDTSFGKWRYRYQNYVQAFQPAWTRSDNIPARRTLKVRDSFINIATGKAEYITTTLRAPFLRVHTNIQEGGKTYMYKGVSPIPYVNKDNQVADYFPPMYPGNSAPGCNPAANDEWRTMHDSDKFTLNCGGPNLVSFTNNSTKYRTFGRHEDMTAFHRNYSWDNLSSAKYGLLRNNRIVDSCRTNQNFPWASDSMEYFWVFNDGEADDCTLSVDTLTGEYIALGSNPSGNPLLCNFSILVAPQHLYLEPDCYTAELTVFDPHTGCEAKAQQAIVMTAPDGGPADPLGPLTPKDVDYYNQTFLLDENGGPLRRGVQVGRGAAPCVGTALNPYFQQIDVGATLPACGRQGIWMVLDAKQDCQAVPCRVEGNGKLIHFKYFNRGSGYNQGEHDIEFVDDCDPSIVAEGKAIVNFLGIVTAIKMGEQDSVFGPNSSATLRFKSSVGGNNDVLITGYTDIDTSYQACNWLDEMTLNMIGWRWSYGSAGWKDIGIVIKTGDCLDTFFYEDYRYFVNSNANFVISPRPMSNGGNIYGIEDSRFLNDTAKMLLEENWVYNPPHKDSLNHRPLKLPRPIALSVVDSMRNNPPLFSNNYHNLDSLKKFQYFIIQTANNCGSASAGLLEDSLPTFPEGFRGSRKFTSDGVTLQGFEDQEIDSSIIVRVDTETITRNICGTQVTETINRNVYATKSKAVQGSPLLVNLNDTLVYTIKTAGKFTVAALAEAGYGPDVCAGGASQEIWVGQLQCFKVSDPVICGQEGKVTFTDSVYYWHRGGQAYCDAVQWVENETCIDTAKYFWLSEEESLEKRIKWRTLMLFGDSTGANAKKYTPPQYWEQVAWDFDAVKGIEDYQRPMDTTRIDFWGHKPAGTLNPRNAGSVTITYGNGKGLDPNQIDTALNLGVGSYDVTLWVRDSMGAWIPNTIKDAVKVVEVQADFGICDSCSYVMVCNPAGVIFQDSSIIYETDTTSSIRDGVNDRIVEWTWDFGDKGDNSFLQDPLKNYLTPDTFDVKLSVVSQIGCTSDTTKKAYIKIIGPLARFSVDSAHGCVPFTVQAFDSSKLVDSWEWELGDGTRINSTEGDDIKLVYNDTGLFELVLRVSSDVLDPISGAIRNCTDFFPNPDREEEPIRIRVRGLDSLKIRVRDTLICPGEEVRFSFDLDGSYAGYTDLAWHLGVTDDTIKQVRTPISDVSQVYTDPGRYKAHMTGSGPWPLCPDFDEIHITVKEVTAKIALGEGRINHSPQIGNYVFLNESQNGVQHTWQFYDENGNELEKIDRNDTSKVLFDQFTNGTYTVVLTVVDDIDPANQCVAVDSLVLDITPLFVAYNVFTPNDDKVNDWFSIKLQAATEYRLTIFNRWGELVFKGDQSDNIECYIEGDEQVCKFWDGTNWKTGAEAPAGTYYFIFDYTFKGEEPKTYNGVVTLLR